MKPNIIFYFSDQQRWDTLNEELMPNVWSLGENGLLFENCFTCQPVCGPARACLQTGVYATQNGCYKNGISLPENTKTLADYFNENGYDTAYIGKWHLASDDAPGKGIHCEKTAIPYEKLGGYKYFRGADVLEFTSHGYDGYVFDEKGNRIDFEGYRADCINDFATEYVSSHSGDNPFFMFISQLEPHHQNDRRHFEGFSESIDKYRDYPIPGDLSFLKGDYLREYPDYLSAINRLDYNVGRLVDTLKEKGIYENTVIVYTSDHGCHFKTRNGEYKRSCHDSSIHIPLVVGGGATEKTGIVDEIVSLVDLPAVTLNLAGIEIPEEYSGRVPEALGGEGKRDCVFVQISESQTARAVRTKKWKYSARAIGSGLLKSGAVHYFDDYLYDLENDPCEKHNLVREKQHRDVILQMRELLSAQMIKAGEKTPVFHKNLKFRRY